MRKKLEDRSIDELRLLVLRQMRRSFDSDPFRLRHHAPCVDMVCVAKADIFATPYEQHR